MTPIEQATAALGLREWAGPLAVAARIVLIVVLALVAHAFSTRLIRTVRIRIAARMSDDEQVRRAETLGRVFRHLAGAIIGVMAGILVLGEIGVSVVPFLGAAGVVGLAIGFGAQSLVKDYFTGILLLFERQMSKGDIVRVADKAGVVEDLTLRYVQLRDYDGHVHFVPNGQITSVTNMTHGFAYSVIDAGVAYREDLSRVEAVMRGVAGELAAEPAYRERIVEAFEYAGVERWDASAVVLRARFKVRPMEQWNVRREFLKRLKVAFDREGIEIPYPHLTVYAGAAHDGSAPPFRVAQVHTGAASEPR
jgi:moderate conductance mechanosensitive channel